MSTSRCRRNRRPVASATLSASYSPRSIPNLLDLQDAYAPTDHVDQGTKMSCGSFDPVETVWERMAREEAFAVALQQLHKMEVEFASNVKKQKAAVEKSRIVPPSY